jgi:hypothetical protein
VLELIKFSYFWRFAGVGIKLVREYPRLPRHIYYHSVSLDYEGSLFFVGVFLVPHNHLNALLEDFISIISILELLWQCSFMKELRVVVEPFWLSI